MRVQISPPLPEGDFMGFNDCAKCWDSPCTCGWDYRSWTKDARIKQAAVVLGVSIELLEMTIKEITPTFHPMLGEKVDFSGG